MKTKLLCLVLFLAAMVLNAQTTAIPDPNFEQALIDLGYDSGTVDGSVPTEAIDTVKSLDLLGHFPSDLTGIQDFKAMDALIYFGSVLPTLDLSKNNKLRFLSIGNNQMNSLILPENNESGIRMFLDNNNLTGIDVSGLNGNNQLFVSGNKLSEIDLGTAEFSTIDVSGNLIVDLNVANATELIILLANNTQLTGLDLSNNSKLEQVQARNARLTSANLRNGANTMLNNDILGSSLLGAPVDFSGNPDLTCIEVDDLAFAEGNSDWVKDVSASYSIDCGLTSPTGDLTQIPDPAFELFLISAGYDSGEVDGFVPTAAIDTVQRLSLEGPDIEFLANDVIRSIEGIADFSALQSLESFRNEITVVDLSNNSNLVSVSVVENGSMDALRLPSGIKKLDLSRSGISTLDVGNLPDLEELFVSQTGIQDLDLSLNPKLKNLAADENGINILDISKNQNLESLSITSANLKTLDLSVHPKLRFVDLFLSVIPTVNVKNGNNQNMRFLANPIIADCIQVDDVDFVLGSPDWDIDPTVSITSKSCDDDGGDIDSDKDGVVDTDDICPDSPQGATVTNNGCAVSQLADMAVENIRIAVGSDPCSEAPSGKVRISLVKNVTLNVTIVKNGAETIFDGAINTTTSGLELDRLGGGDYEICVGIPLFPAFSQCFNVTYGETENSVTTEITMQKEAFYPITVFGSLNYEVLVNGVTTVEEFDSTDERGLGFSLQSGKNTITITGQLECQEDTADELSTDFVNYPNPAQNVFSIDGLGTEERAQVVLRNSAGSKVYEEMRNIIDGRVEMDISGLSAGVYFLTTVTAQGVKTSKVLKR